MPTIDPRVDAYIAKAPAFAQPILTHVRAVIHAVCPDVVETMKWSVPHFDYQGPMFQMAAFKEHCRLVFWKGALLFGDPAATTTDGDVSDVPDGNSAGPYGRVTSVKDVPKSAFGTYVRKAAALNASGVKVVKAPRSAKGETVVPDDLAAALAQAPHAKAKAAWDAFSPSHRREYAEWIGEAKAPATRQRRLEQTLEQLAEGKSKHWKYQRS